MYESQNWALVYIFGVYVSNVQVRCPVGILVCLIAILSVSRSFMDFLTFVPPSCLCLLANSHVCLSVCVSLRVHCTPVCLSYGFAGVLTRRPTCAFGVCLLGCLSVWV